MEFVDILNSHHPSIKVKWELKADKIDFLDTTIYKGPEFLETGKLDAKVFLSQQTLMLYYTEAVTTTSMCSKE